MRVLGHLPTLRTMMPYGEIVAVASPERKRQIVGQIRRPKSIECPLLAYLGVSVAESAKIGEGVVIYPGVTINHHARASDFVTINMGCVLGHAVHIDSYSSIDPQVGLAGHTLSVWESTLVLALAPLRIVGSVLGASSVPEQQWVGICRRTEWQWVCRRK